MKLHKEPKEIDFTIKSEPWSDKDLADFKVLIQKLKTSNKRKKILTAAKKARMSAADKIL